MIVKDIGKLGMINDEINGKNNSKKNKKNHMKKRIITVKNNNKL
jgi:hypothetical protein